MPTPQRVKPYASVKLLHPGHGDPLVIKRGFAWYDLPVKSGGDATVSVDALGIPLLEAREKIGLTPRRFWIPKDTRDTQYTKSGGLWEETLATAGGRRVYKLSQYDASSAVTAYAATSTWTHPRDALFAFTYILPDTPSSWDYVANPPFVRTELGGTWGLQFAKDGAYLMRNTGGAWRAVKSLGSPPRGVGYMDQDEIIAWMEVARGKIGVSFDFGHTWDYYPDTPGDGGCSIPPGRLVLRGRGGQVTFGAHQLACYSGTYDAGTRDTGEPRLTATPTITGRYDAPPGALSNATVDYTDLGEPLARVAGYRVTLAPGQTPGIPFTWYHPPVLYSTTYRIPPEVQPSGNTKTNPWDRYLLALDVDEGEQLDTSSCTVTFHHDAHTLFSDALRFRKVEVELGYRLDDGTDEVYTSFVGYIEAVDPQWRGSPWGKVTVKLTIANAAARFRRPEWTVLEAFPLGGMTPNDAADAILALWGLGPSYRDWHALGGVKPLDAGLPEDPVEMIRPRETPWEMLKRIFAYQKLELGVRADGTFYTVPFNFVETSSSWTYTATGEGSTDAREQVAEVGQTTDFKRSATAALVWCTDEAGRLVVAFANDQAAETDTDSDRFIPWRECKQEELSGTPSAGMALERCQALAAEWFALKREPTVSAPVHPGLTRRKKVTVNGCAGVGIPDGSGCGIWTLRHEYRAKQGLTGLRTTAGLRRTETL